MNPQEIRKNHSQSALINAIEDNHLAFLTHDFQNIAEPYTPQIESGEEMLRFYTGLPIPMFNAVYPFRFDEHTLESRIRETLEYFRSRKVPQMWWLGARFTPSEIEDILVNQGLKKSEWDSPGMAVNLKQLDDSKLQELTDRSGASMRRVETKADWERWMSAFIGSYELGDITNSALQSVTRALLKDTENSHFILAEIDGEPAGVSLAVLREGIVGLYMVGTVKEYRGRGVGSLVSLAAIIEGRNRGYEIAILNSSKMGYNAYSRLGFKEYFRYRFYVDVPQ